MKRFKLRRSVSDKHIWIKERFEQAFNKEHSNHIHVEFHVSLSQLVSEEYKESTNRDLFYTGTVPILVISFHNNPPHAKAELAALWKDDVFSRLKSLWLRESGIQCVIFDRGFAKEDLFKEMLNNYLPLAQEKSEKSLMSPEQRQVSQLLVDLEEFYTENRIEQRPIISFETSMCEIIRACDDADLDDPDLDDDFTEKKKFLGSASFDHVVFCKRRRDKMKRRYVPVLVLEYDGRQHRDAPNAKRDRMKNEICIEAGLPLIRMDMHSLPPCSDFRYTDNEYLAREAAASLINTMVIYAGYDCINEMLYHMENDEVIPIDLNLKMDAHLAILQFDEEIKDTEAACDVVIDIQTDQVTEAEWSWKCVMSRHGDASPSINRTGSTRFTIVADPVRKRILNNIIESGLRMDLLNYCYKALGEDNMRKLVMLKKGKSIW